MGLVWTGCSKVDSSYLCCFGVLFSSQPHDTFLLLMISLMPGAVCDVHWVSMWGPAQS